MTLVKCLACNHVWTIESNHLPIIGKGPEPDDKLMTEPCPNCGLIMDLLYVGANIVLMRRQFTSEELSVIKRAVDFTIGLIQSCT